MYRLSIETTISAAHRLRNYQGACSRLHGHNWKMRVEISTDTLNEVGMAIDFKDLKDIAWQVVGRFDHQVFNEIAPFNDINPTAENIVLFFFEEIEHKLPKGIRLEKISLWETEKYRVDYERNR